MIPAPRSRRTPRRTPRRFRAVVVVPALVTALAGCSSGSDAPASVPSSSVATSSAGPSSPPTTPAAPTSSTASPVAGPLLPLTGLPGTADRPAVVVKIENSAAARPQRGLAAADIVVEELVEGGITRFAAFYHSKDPGSVGPVRSVRNVDAQIAGPTRGVLAFSGGAKVALRVVRKADLRLVAPGDVGGAFFRSPAKPAPHNLYLRVARLWTVPDARHAAAPEPYLPFAAAPGADGPSAAADGSGAVPAGGRAVAVADLRFSGAERPAWTWAAGPGRWLRSETGGRPARDASGARLAADTVLVLRVRVGDAGYRDPAGNPVPETRFTGSGAATLLSGGRAVTGVWSKRSGAAPLVLTRDDGTPLLVPPGRTWVELLPTAGTLRLS